MDEPARLVYLDSAIIDDVADGKRYPQSAADDLHVAMREADAALVISFAHVWDFTRRTDEATRERVCAAVDAFPSVVMLLEDPTEGERENLLMYGGREEWKCEPDELLPQQLTAKVVEDFAAEVLFNHGMVSRVEQVVSAAMKMTDAGTLGREAARMDASAQPDRAVASRAFDALTHAESAEDLLAFLRAQIEQKPPEERAKGEAMWPQMEAQINALWSTLAPHLPQMRATFSEQALPADKAWRLMVNKTGLSSVGFAGANVRGDAARRAEVMAWLSPGLALVAALAAHNAKNVERELRYSDQADLEHMKYVPYVDLATVDAPNLDVVGRLRPSLRCPRLALVERNPPGGAGAVAALGALAARIRQLGTAT